MRKLDFDRFAQWDRTALLELGDTIEEQIRRGRREEGRGDQEGAQEAEEARRGEPLGDHLAGLPRMARTGEGACPACGGHGIRNGWRGSSDGQSARFIPASSGVQIPPPLPTFPTPRES